LPTSAPRRITNWAGFKIYSLSRSADGDRLTFAKWSEQDTALVGDLEADGAQVKQIRPLAASEGYSIPYAWTADSKAVILFSDRNGTWDILKQPLDQESAETIVAGPGVKDLTKLSPDGSWIVYVTYPDEGGPSTPVRLMRVPVSGGPSQLVMESRGYDSHSCSIGSEGFCVVKEVTPDLKEQVFTAFDPFKGRGREVWRDTKPSGLGWNLSMDGSRLAIVTGEEREHQIRIVSLREGTAQDLTVKGWSGILWIDWAADGRAVLASAVSPRGVTLLRVDMKGNAQPLWESRSAFNAYGMASPDGRHLAIATESSTSNIWMLENF
jgi:Tol biopolymer transport system component